MKRVFLVLFSFLLASSAFAFTSSFDGNMSSSTYSTDQNFDLLVPQVDQLSLQAVYFPVSPSAVSFTDGTRSTGTITISSGSTAVSNAVVSIGDRTLTEGVNWTKQTTASDTAKSLFAACTTYITGIDFTLEDSDTVIYATASVVGVNYTLSSTTPTAIVVTNMTGGVSSDINYPAGKISKTNTYPTGLAVLYTAAANSPTGLTSGTTYYAISGNGAYFSLATSQSNAIAGTAISMAKPTNDNGDTYTVTPLDLAGDYGLVLKASNDGENWSDLSVASVTYSAAGGSVWDFGSYNFKYIRAAFTTGTSGALKVILRYFGKY